MPRAPRAKLCTLAPMKNLPPRSLAQIPRQRIERWYLRVDFLSEKPTSSIRAAEADEIGNAHKIYATSAAGLNYPLHSAATNRELSYSGTMRRLILNMNDVKVTSRNLGLIAVATMTCAACWLIRCNSPLKSELYRHSYTASDYG